MSYTIDTVEGVATCAELNSAQRRALRALSHLYFDCDADGRSARALVRRCLAEVRWCEGRMHQGKRIGSAWGYRLTEAGRRRKDEVEA